MPELPEVEVTRRGLLPMVPGQTVKDIWWSGKKLRTSLPVQLLERTVKHQLVTTIDRRAKYLLFRLDNSAVLVIHLGMTGKLSFLPRQHPRAKHDHLALLLSDGNELRLNDSRRFGQVLVWPPTDAEEREQRFSAREGIEPLGDEFTAEALLQLARGKKVGIKPFLMNSRYIAGIGNIYANETLFQAGVHPGTPAQQITLQEWQAIAAAATHILEQAIRAGGTTISDFLGSSGQPGYFQLQLNVYGNDKSPCPRCSHPISKMQLGGRSTFFCGFCQVKK